MPNQRRGVLRLGAILLLVSAAFGLAAASPVSYPAQWMRAHVTALMFGTMIIAEGLLWNDLRLSDGQRTWLVRLIHVSTWSGLALGVSSALLDIPGPATAPNVSPVGIQVPILLTLLALIIPTTIATWSLLWIGLRGNKPA